MGKPSKVVILREWPKRQGERARLALDEFQGHRLIDLRITAQLGASEVYSPTRKGVALKVEHLDDLIAGLLDAKAHLASEGEVVADG